MIILSFIMALMTIGVLSGGYLATIAYIESDYIAMGVLGSFASICLGIIIYLQVIIRNHESEK